MSRVKAVLGVVLIFLMGVFAGVLGLSLFEKKIIQEALRGSPRATTLLVDRMSRRLDLDPQERELLRQTVQESRQKLREIRQETLSRVEKVFQEAEEKILAFLNEGQKGKFKKLTEKRKAFLRKLSQE
ncbi:MAG: hypothetical protein HYS08_09275 [Chlamydiae bacterium]|nr:hypothetical protein [Chlamydiota bacterium]MBI3267329.1 hypothetical protein [Chlamydiota bacterium]